jgi:hypothetical protein
MAKSPEIEGSGTVAVIPCGTPSSSSNFVRFVPFVVPNYGFNRIEALGVLVTEWRH